MTTLLDHPTENLMHVWRRQIGHRHGIAQQRGPRPFAVISYLVRGPQRDDRLVELRQLTLVALYDEQSATGALATRFVGVVGRVDADGLHFGGIERSRFDKDLRLAPATGRRGRRLDSSEEGLLQLALKMEAYLERAARHEYMPRRRVPRLPEQTADDNRGETCFVDLATLPKRQVITLASPSRDLVGRSGTTVFDFVNTRFRVAR